MREVRPLIAALCLLPLFPAVAPSIALAAEATASSTAGPTIDQIHTLAASGHVDQALAQMGGVLKQHPGSAKAHYVEAELLARESRLQEARSELARAQQLAPGLPFADVYSVAELNRQLALGASGAGAVSAAPAAAREAGAHIPWGAILAIGAVAFGLFMMFRRRVPPPTGQMSEGPVQGPWSGAPIGMQGGAWGSPASGGMGSGLLGSLASGAAMGAGFAAGEEVIDKMFGGGERRNEGQTGSGAFGYGAGGGANQDMGGNDFGIADDSSWDDSSTDSGGW